MAESANLEQCVVELLAQYKAIGWRQRSRLKDCVTIPELTLNVSIHEADPRLGQPMTISRSELLGILLNTGKTSNFKKFLAGEKWSENPESAAEQKRVRDLLLNHTNEQDLELLQTLWKGVGKLWPHIVESQRELTDVVPEEVAPLQFEWKGKTYTGGYWPVVWDNSRTSTGKNKDDLMGIGPDVGPMKYDIQIVLTDHLPKVAKNNGGKKERTVELGDVLGLLLVVAIFLVLVFPLAALAFRWLGPWALVLLVPILVLAIRSTAIPRGFKDRCHGVEFDWVKRPYGESELYVPTWKLGWRVADFLSRGRIGRLIVNYRDRNAYRAGFDACHSGVLFVNNPYSEREELRSWNEGWQEGKDCGHGFGSSAPAGMAPAPEGMAE